MKDNISKSNIILDEMLCRNPILEPIREKIYEAFTMFCDCYSKNGKIIIAGNGGSAADAEHIVCELMKRFRATRHLSPDFREKLVDISPQYGNELYQRLEKPFPALSLTSNAPLITAFINDTGSSDFFAQQLLGLSKSEDIFLAISTSGNSRNIINASIVAQALGNKTIALTGKSGGELSTYSDIAIMVPEEETYLIQEFHQKIYHCWCLMLEDYFFRGNHDYR